MELTFRNAQAKKKVDVVQKSVWLCIVWENNLLSVVRHCRLENLSKMKTLTEIFRK